MANKPKKAREINTKKVSGFDVAQTPAHAIEPLIPLIPKEWVIWESAAGPEQLLLNAFSLADYHNIGTDLLYDERHNYFTYVPDFHYDIEITNVPFSLKYKWIERAFERKHRFAFIVPYETTAAAVFQKLAAKYHNQPWAIEVLAPERRINFKMPEMGWGKYVYDEKRRKEVWRDTGAQMPTIFLTWGLNAKIHYQMYIDTYAVPMRNVKYDESNTERKK